MVTFSVGDLFNSFADIQQKLAEYSEQTYSHFYIKDSKKLAPDEIINPNLIYKHIVYSCIYGGQKPRFRGSGCRSVTSIRHGCSASLYLRVTKDRAHLQVRNFSEQHNHDVSEEMFRSAAQDKKLPEDLKTEIEELLLLGADKDRLIEYIRYVTHKNLEKKNLFNIYDAAIKQQREISRDRAIMLIQKAYAVDSEDEADQILQQLLATTRPARRPRKQDVELMENVQVAYYNDGDDSQGAILEDGEDPVDESLQRLMGTLSGHEGERIVILQQDDDPIEVIEAENQLEVSEYLDDEEKDTVVIKQELQNDGSGTGPRYLTINDLSRSYTSRKRAVVKGTPSKAKANTTTYIQNNDDEPPTKTRIISAYEESEEAVLDGLTEARLEKIRAEQEKLVAETEMLKLMRNKIVKDISKLDVEKTKLTLEIDLIKQRKKYVDAKSSWMQNEVQTGELRNEKLRLQIAQLKIQLSEN